MRLWSVHPCELDSRGLVALWREALLAQAVLRGETKGYRHHPQLVRFQTQDSPTDYIAEYLNAVYAESFERGFRFDAGKISPERTSGRIDVPHGQIAFEWQHLMSKLSVRAPATYESHKARWPRIHPLFKETPGELAEWERP